MAEQRASEEDWHAETKQVYDSEAWAVKGEFLIQVNVASGANSGLERSQGTFTRIVTFFSHKPKNAFSIVSKAAEILHCYFITTSRLKAKYWLVSRSSTGQKSKIQVMTSRFECAWCCDVWIFSRWVLSLCRWASYLATDGITLLSQFYLFITRWQKVPVHQWIYIWNYLDTGEFQFQSQDVTD